MDIHGYQPDFSRAVLVHAAASETPVAYIPLKKGKSARVKTTLDFAVKIFSEAKQQGNTFSGVVVTGRLKEACSAIRALYA